MTTLLSVDKLPGDESDLYRIEYDLEDIVGIGSGDLEDGVVWDEHIEMVDGRFRRISRVNDRVSVPGGSSVGVWAFVKNESGHDVTVKDFMFFTARSNRVLGNLALFGVQPSGFGNEHYQFYDNQFRKFGDFVDIPLVVNIEKDEEKIFKLTSFDIFQALQVEYFDWEPNILENGDLIVDFELKLKSIAPFRMRYIDYIHRDFFDRKTYYFEDEYTYEYQVNYGKEYSVGLNLLDSFRIEKMGPKTECLVMGSTDFINSTSDSRSLVYTRSDIDGGQDWFGKSVDVDWYPRREAMCITIIGYSLVGKPLEFYFPADVNVNLSSEKEVLDINDDFVLKLKVQNTGMDFDSLDLELDFNTDFQKIKSSSCEINGNFLNVGSLKTEEEFFCEIVFEVLEKEKFLILENSVILDGEIIDSFSFKYIPDLEISFSYDYDLKDFLFESNMDDISSLSKSSYFFEGLLCKKITFLGLEDEVCI